MTDPLVPTAPEVRLLSEREGRRPTRSRAEPIPRALHGQLRRWLEEFLHPHLERRLALRLGLELTARGSIPRSVDPPTRLALHPALDDPELMLDAVDLALRWDEALDNQWWLPAELTRDGDGDPFPQFGRLRELDDLVQMLEDSGSTYQVWAPSNSATPRLALRVDPTAQGLADRAMATADTTAASLLKRAWSKAYGRETDPDGAYLDALRAVEALACPLVLPDSTRRTLSTVIRHLTDAPHKWELTLTERGTGTVVPFTAMLARLWHGNLASRHGDAESAYREVTLEEARAGLHLAVTCVQWLTDGVLRRRTTGSGTP